MEKVVLLRKPISFTPLQAINKFKKENPEFKDKKMSYAGRLDPMAEGLLVCLVGEENKKREEYQNLDKEYTFEVLFGVSTDTYDVMGLPDSVYVSGYPEDLENRVEKSLDGFRGEFKQKFPPYSSYRIEGKPLFWWAREGKLDQIKIPQKEVEVKKLSQLGSYEMEVGQIMEEVVERISKVKGEFRQKQIISRWEQFAKENADKKLRIFKFNCSTTSGTYIRSIAHYLGQKIGVGAIAFKILRTKVGEFQLEDAVSINNATYL
ncbi:MAG: hypothetical protein ABEJ24_02515 [Candidatus Magasanikbacteria bacterium]